MSAKHYLSLALGVTLALGGCIGGTKKGDQHGLCGNGVIDPGEQCDDGNTVEHDGCSSKCVVESFCGNGVVEVNEECDDGNFVDGDGCTALCDVESGCGNGILELGEECDDDNLFDGDGCTALCVDEVLGAVCGNGVLELGEGCDDWNQSPGDGCDGACMREDGCGNGTRDASELCDDGNNVSGDGCSAACLVEFVCGNEYCETESYESCELCPRDCCPSCGDGILDEGEGCDDGNNANDDGCSKGCRDEDGVATCGNGIWEAGEECEDGNLTIHDGCSDECLMEFECGDQICERDMGENCERCRSDCCPNCGNGVLEPLLEEWCDNTELAGKTCEDLGFMGGMLACTDHCTFETSGCTGTGPDCGNGQAEYGEACDGGDLRGLSCLGVGWSGGSLSCTSSCSLDTSGCTGLLWFFHEDFEDQASATGDWIYTGAWDWGTPTTGPSACLEGTRCAGTVMGGTYSANLSYDTCVLESPPISLAGATAPTLSLFMWLYSQASYDGGNVKVSSNGGATWSALVPVGGYDGTAAGEQAFYGDKQALGWHRKVFDLSAYAGQTIKLRFAFASNSYTEYDGWYLDEIYITEAVDVPVRILSRAALGVGVTDLGFTRSLSADGGAGIFDWTIRSGGTNDSWLSIDPVVGTLSGTPMASNLGPVEVIVRASVPGRPTNFDERTFQIHVVEPAVLPYSESFDTSPVTWTFGTGDWEWGAPSTSGPASCLAGSCVGTKISGLYSINLAYSTCFVESPPISLSGSTEPTLSLFMWLYSQASYDGGNVKVSNDNGVSWAVLTPDGGYDGTAANEPAFYGDKQGLGWHREVFDLSAYVGQTIRLRFAFASNSSTQYAGWYLDEINVTEAADVPVQILTPDDIGLALVGLPYSRPLSADGGTGTLDWTILPGGTNYSWLSIDPTTGTLSGTPALQNLGPVVVNVRASVPGNPTNFSEKAFTLSVVQGIWSESFDSGPNGWTFGGDWQHGVASGVGPGSCYSGSCIATVLAGNYNNSLSWATCNATSPAISLAGATAPILQFRSWIRTEGSSYDGGNLKISTNGTTFTQVTTVTPAYNLTSVDGQTAWGDDTPSWTSQWTVFQADLSAWAGQTVYLRFSFRTDGSVVYPGWYVDDLMILN